MDISISTRYEDIVPFTNLELADNPGLLIELLLRLLAPVQLEGVEPLREAFKLLLALQLVRVHLAASVNIKCRTNFYDTFQLL